MNTHTGKQKTKPEQMSRTQRRFQQRVQEQVSEVSTELGEAFLRFFTTCANPEGEEVIAKMDQMDKQWRVFCQNKNLVKDAYPHMRGYMEGIVKQYYAVLVKEDEITKSELKVVDSQIV